MKKISVVFLDKPILIGSTFLFLMISAEFISILILNNGHFTYTLDDPYIHLTMAEHIKTGHYGINLNEYSAPSSSILWPFFLALFSSLNLGVFVPLLVNILSSFAVLMVMRRIIELSFCYDEKEIKTVIVSFFLVLFILCTNMVGLIFTGMEHSLQLLIIVMIACGMIIKVSQNRLEHWFLIMIVLAPLIRYENIAISLAALIFLVVQKNYKISFILFAIIVLLLGSFSLFLMNLGLEPLPTSILSKSSLAMGLNVKSVLSDVIENIRKPIGVALLFGLLSLTAFILLSNQNDKKYLAGTVIFATFLHFLAGKFGGRYEIYIVGFCISVMFFVFSDVLSKLFIGKQQTLKAMSIFAFGAFIIFPNYIFSLFTIPLASNNIYEQQYQMHRFAVDYYNKPIAVNDIGYVSYKNPNYVLDLYGMASIDILRKTLDQSDMDWICSMPKIKGVHFAMIYESDFNIPKEWIKMGDLHLGKIKISPSDNVVAFYALDKDTYGMTLSLLKRFQEGLPSGVKFIFPGQEIHE